MARKQMMARNVLGLLAVFLVYLPFSAAHAQERSYWLVHGGQIKRTCPGEQNGRALRAANSDNQWVLITAVLSCRDVGDAYQYSIDYMKVEINPARDRSSIERSPIVFDGIGFAVYGPSRGGAAVDWLYDEALPIKGQLDRNSEEPIYFGRLQFPKVLKSQMEAATNVSLYLTAQNIPFVFGLR